MAPPERERERKIKNKIRNLFMADSIVGLFNFTNSDLFSIITFTGL
jgi:hypothetical protein